MKKTGFTLVELIIVIVILGVLALTAAPRFLNLQSDSREAVLDAAKGALIEADGIIYGKSAIGGEEGEAHGLVRISDDESIETVFGHLKLTKDNVLLAMETGLRVGELNLAPDIHGIYMYQSDEELTPEQSKCYMSAINVTPGYIVSDEHELGEIIFSKVVIGC